MGIYSRHVAQLASSAIRRHSIPVEIVEFNGTLKSLNVRGCQLGNGKVRLATYWSLEGSVSWVKYLHVLVGDTPAEMSDFMQIDLEGFFGSHAEALGGLQHLVVMEILWLREMMAIRAQCFLPTHAADSSSRRSNVELWLRVQG